IQPGGALMEISRWCKPPDLSHREVNSPGRGWGRLSHIPLIEFHTAALKQCQILLLKRVNSMMLLLLLNVTADVFQLRSAYSERSISFLPRERAGIWRPARSRFGDSPADMALFRGTTLNRSWFSLAPPTDCIGGPMLAKSPAFG